jgi:hypothetical protein
MAVGDLEEFALGEFLSSPPRIGEGMDFFTSASKGFRGALARRFSEVACLSRATRMNSGVVILLFLVGRVKYNLKFCCWYEPM